MKKLLALIEKNDEPFIFPAGLQAHHIRMSDKLGAAYAMMIREQYLEDTPHLDPLSGSQIGKPGILLAWNKFYPFQQQPASFALKRKWLGGHMFELEVMFWLERLGYQYEWQPEIKVFNAISGHPDFLVTDEEGKQFIVECKHVGASVYKAYQKGMYNKGYITQFALYCSHYKCGGMWLVGNTDTGEMTAIVLPNYDQVVQHYYSYVTEAMKNWVIISEAESFEECIVKGITLPAPNPRQDGTLGIVPELYASKGVLHPVCQLYDIRYDEKLRPCVVGVNLPVSLAHLKPEWANGL